MTVKMIVKSYSEVCLGCRGCSSLIILFCFTIYLIGGVLILWEGYVPALLMAQGAYRLN